MAMSSSIAFLPSPKPEALEAGRLRIIGSERLDV
jgi:hypothetical protein